MLPSATETPDLQAASSPTRKALKLERPCTAWLCGTAVPEVPKVQRVLSPVGHGLRSPVGLCFCCGDETIHLPCTLRHKGEGVSVFLHCHEADCGGTTYSSPDTSRGPPAPASG